MQWSPCSTLISLGLHSGALLVMNTSLETVYIWDSLAPPWECPEAIHAWAPSCTFMAAMRPLRHPGLPYGLVAC